MEVSVRITMLLQETGTPESVSAWVAFLEMLESEYAQLAAEHGEPCRRLSHTERLAVAEMAAGLGVQPSDALVQLLNQALGVAAENSSGPT